MGSLWRSDRARLVGVLLFVMAVGLLLRAPDLFAGLPSTPQPDEGTTVTRAWAALQDRQFAPPTWDWPPLSALLLAAAAGAARVTGLANLPEATSLFTFGRVVFLGIAVLVIGASAGLAWRAAEERDRTIAGLGAGLLVAVSFVAVRSARSINPDHLQMLLVAVSVTVALHADRRGGTWPWLATAGAAAGLAGATKYLGAVAAVAAIGVALGRAGWPARTRGVAVVGVSGLLGFIAGTAGSAFDVRSVADGLAWQFRHQAEGHLGFEATGNGLWFHLRESWVGNWGIPLTVVMIVALVTVVLRGTRPERLLAAPLLGFLAFTITTNVRFPHYILPGLPLAAALLAVWVARASRALTLDRWRPQTVAALSLGLLVATAAPTVAHDLRLVRHASVLDTRVLVDERLAELGLDGSDVLAESYASAGRAQVVTFTWGDSELDPLDCACVILISNYQEGRYRRLPDRYADEVAVYEALRAAGDVIDVVGPDVELSYRWDGLPQWGVGALPLTGPPSPTGPTVTILDLRRPPGG